MTHQKVTEMTVKEGRELGAQYPVAVVGPYCTAEEGHSGPHVAVWNRDDRGSLVSELAIALFMVSSIIAAGLIAAGQATGLVQQVVAVIGLGQ